MKRFLFFSLIGLPISLFSQGLPDKPYIYVEGKAEIEKPADIMMLRFDVVGRAPQRAEVERVIVTPNYRFAPVKITQRVHVIYLISPAK